MGCLGSKRRTIARAPAGGSAAVTRSNALRDAPTTSRSDSKGSRLRVEDRKTASSSTSGKEAPRWYTRSFPAVTPRRSARDAIKATLSS